MICFDTQLLIWGVQRHARAGQVALIERTRRFIQRLDAEKRRVMIPTPVLAEYLVGIPPEDHGKHCEVLERQFFIPPLDVTAAQIAARLQATLSMTDLQKKSGVDRPSLRMDALIVAIAIAHGAERIITHDGHFRKIAQGEIAISEVPVIEDQRALFE